MRYSFNFIQIANWLIACREALNNIADKVEEKNLTQEEVIALLEREKKKIEILYLFLKLF